MRSRHAVLIAFGLGALAAIALVSFNHAAVFHIQGRSVGGSLEPSPSPSPSSPSPAPTSPSPPLATVGAPGPRSGAAVVYDPENRGLILFGGAHTETTPDGHNLGISTADTWLWDGSAWRQLEVQGPSARSAAMAAYDSVRHVIVLFGGAGPDAVGKDVLLNDTWTWDGVQWTEMTPAHTPPARYRAALAFDQRHGVTVLYGGEGPTNTPYADTWTWNGEDWTLQDPATSPTARHYPAMAYDAERGNTVMFGGTAAGVRLNDTWIWDGSTWARQTAGAPTARGFAYMTYDSKTKKVVAYVYYALDNHPVAEYTIVWDGARWTDRSTPSDPSPRADGSIAFDEATGQVVLYGGVFDQPQPFAEMWVWNGTTWSLWQPPKGA
jgi:hypothetical protein